jgi:hypothetical protein
LARRLPVSAPGGAGQCARSYGVWQGGADHWHGRQWARARAPAPAVAAGTGIRAQAAAGGPNFDGPQARYAPHDRGFRPNAPGLAWH